MALNRSCVQLGFLAAVSEVLLAFCTEPFDRSGKVNSMHAGKLPIIHMLDSI